MVLLKQGIQVYMISLEDTLDDLHKPSVSEKQGNAKTRADREFLAAFIDGNFCVSHGQFLNLVSECLDG